MHDRVVDPALPPELGNGLAFRLQPFALEPLVLLRALLELAVVLVREAGGKPVPSEVHQASSALERVREDPFLLGELVEPSQRGLGRIDASLRLLFLVETVVLDSKCS